MAPPHSILSWFRSILTKAVVYEPLFKEINRQLKSHQISIRTGGIVDASVIDTSLKRKGKTTHKVTEGREDIEEVGLMKEYAKSLDKRLRG